MVEVRVKTLRNNYNRNTFSKKVYLFGTDILLTIVHHTTEHIVTLFIDVQTR